VSKTKIAAHTGCGIHPDNTMASFLEGLRSGAHIVEVDVRTTKDGIAVLLHDDSPLLRQYEYEQLNRPEFRSKLNPAYGEYPLVRLEEALSLARTHGVSLNLDVKSDDAVAPTVRELRRFEAESLAYLTGCTALAAKLAPDIRSFLNTPDAPSNVLADAALYERFADAACEEAKSGGYVGLNMDHASCLKPIVDKARAAGLLAWVYTVNEESEMRRLLDAGVDGMTTRRVEKLRACAERKS